MGPTNLLIEKFEKGLPSWFPDIKETAMGKIRSLPLVQACAKGDEDAIRFLLKGFAPFIEEFPEHIGDTTSVMVRGKYLNEEQKGYFRELLKKVSRLLPEIRKDEEEHRKLWIKSAQVLGISEEAYLKSAETQNVPEMQRLLNLTHDTGFPPRTLIRFAAVEIVAEALSKTVLAEPVFCEKMGSQGVGWFRVHAEPHGEETHETLVLKLAFSLLKRKEVPRLDPSPEEVDRLIQETTDAFVAVANAWKKERVN